MRVALVTGAAGGMGRAISDRLLADGLHVIGVDIDGAALLAMAADRDGFTPEAVDVTDPDAIIDLFERMTNRFGGVDVLVNNAGTCLMSDFPDIPAAELTRQMEINFHSAFHCCQQAVKAMARRPGVRKIVNISSNGAYNFDVFDPPHYRASKAAMDTLTKDLARRYARDKIAVNSIAPAMTETSLFNVLT
ncbi:MAG: 3-oxoacyl-ACP reductase, partial [Rhodobacterales bacterium 17-64-5]